MKQLVCNELSFPTGVTSKKVEDLFIKCLNTFKQAKEQYNFTHISFPSYYSEIILTCDNLNLYEWLQSCRNINLKNLILSIFKKPFSDELNEDELNLFCGNCFRLIDQNGNLVLGTPLGLSVAYIKSMPAISFESDMYWRKKRIYLNKINEVGENVGFEYVYNICREEDVFSLDLKEWFDSYLLEDVNTKDDLFRLLGFQKYKINISDLFWADFLYWQKYDKSIYRRLISLMKDIEIHSFTGGLGKTEKLLGQVNAASKRITDEHRLVYSIDNNIVFLVNCKTHYDR